MGHNIVRMGLAVTMIRVSASRTTSVVSTLKEGTLPIPVSFAELLVVSVMAMRLQKLTESLLRL